MLYNFEYMEKLKSFLAVNFHQDFESEEEAIKEILEDYSDKSLNKVFESIEWFLKADIELNEKNKFIENEAYVYFEQLGLTPVEWLEELLNKLKIEKMVKVKK